MWPDNRRRTRHGRRGRVVPAGIHRLCRRVRSEDRPLHAAVRRVSRQGGVCHVIRTQGHHMGTATRADGDIVRLGLAPPQRTKPLFYARHARHGLWRALRGGEASLGSSTCHGSVGATSNPILKRSTVIWSHRHGDMTMAMRCDASLLALDQQPERSQRADLPEIEVELERGRNFVRHVLLLLLRGERGLARTDREYFHESSPWFVAWGGSAQSSHRRAEGVWSFMRTLGSFMSYDFL